MEVKQITRNAKMNYFHLCHCISMTDLANNGTHEDEKLLRYNRIDYNCIDEMFEGQICQLLNL